ncbi:carbohydrate sulfotransferase 1-like [Amphiura filiformis]|uniref:carbohydrate sulfotransferase 1-like n=1 Tax=Amphiura filiformis TaxID=82378 RepID=UPI003B2159B9
MGIQVNDAPLLKGKERSERTSLTMKWRRLVFGSIGIVSIYILLNTVRNLVSLNANYLARVGKNKETLQPMDISKDRKVHVIIISRWRYGSTFTGGILNNNPDFTYFYEPLRGKMYEKQEEDRKLHHDQITMLHDILKCEFTNKNYTWWDAKDTWLNCENSKKLGNSMLCERSSAKKPDKSPDLLGKKRTHRRISNSQSKQQYLSTYFSKTSRSRMVEEICRSGKHVAIKTVRVPDLKHLKSIVMDDSLNVKVIQLVRDPRGVYLSRKVMSSVVDMELSECDELKNNLNYWKEPPSWLKGRYMLLRYEDLADDPTDMVQIIYDFLGLPVPETVKTWLRINEMKRSSSSKSAYSWRTKITYKTMVTVQRYCMDLLLTAGYKPVNSEKDLTNLKIPSIRKFSYPLMPSMTTGVAKPTMRFGIAEPNITFNLPNSRRRRPRKGKFGRQT